MPREDFSRVRNEVIDDYLWRIQERIVHSDNARARAIFAQARRNLSDAEYDELTERYLVWFTSFRH
jgi:hypothetical protein